MVLELSRKSFLSPCARSSFLKIAPMDTRYLANKLLVLNNILYMIIRYILLLAIRGQAKIRFPYLCMMYALHQKLDVNITLNIFRSIIQHCTPPRKQVLRFWD